jgi:hypothetical protein
MLTMSTVVGRRTAAVREFVLVGILYLAYTGSRVLADNSLTPAIHRARDIVTFETDWDLDWEHWFNHLFTIHAWLGVPADFWYSSAHYIVTAGTLIWLWRRSRDTYLTARRALALATIGGLILYLLMPTAPPRLLGGYVDVLSLHSHVGWWGADASAPKGMGGLTNELAAFPSLHAGWSLWVALAVRSATYNRYARAAAWAYAAITALVVIGTANHWVADVLVGWAISMTAWLITDQATRLAARRVQQRFVASLPHSIAAMSPMTTAVHAVQAVRSSVQPPSAQASPPGSASAKKKVAAYLPDADLWIP